MAVGQVQDAATTVIELAQKEQHADHDEGDIRRREHDGGLPTRSAVAKLIHQVKLGGLIQVLDDVQEQDVVEVVRGERQVLVLQIDQGELVDQRPSHIRRRIEPLHVTPFFLQLSAHVAQPAADVQDGRA